MRPHLGLGLGVGVRVRVGVRVKVRVRVGVRAHGSRHEGQQSSPPLGVLAVWMRAGSGGGSQSASAGAQQQQPQHCPAMTLGSLHSGTRFQREYTTLSEVALDQPGQAIQWCSRPARERLARALS
jgi:hypothetical protein